MTLPRRLALLAAAFLLLAGFSTQPMDERQAQDLLPMSGDPVWGLLATTDVALDEQQGLFSATFSDAVKALDGKPLTITGFMLPLEADETFHHFLLSKRTPTCPFCPPGEPNEIVEVTTRDAVAWDDGPVTVTGRFSLTNDQEMGLFFKLDDAGLN